MQVRKAIGTYTSSFALPITDIDKLKIVKKILLSKFENNFINYSLS